MTVLVGTLDLGLEDKGIGKQGIPIKIVLIGTFLISSIVVLVTTLGQTSNQESTVQNILKDHYFLWFKYKNGDELIIADRVIIPFSKTVIAEKIKIDGFSWDLSNLKYGLKDLTEGDYPISLLIPNIHISNNKLPAVIPFGLRDTELVICFIDTDEIKSLVLTIKRENPKSETLLNYPILDEIKFTKEDFHILSEKIATTHGTNKFESFYVDETAFE